MTVVAVYGSLRKGMGNHSLLMGQTFVGTTQTTEAYAMYSLGGFPKVELQGDKVSPIVVELYDVDDKGLSRLDMLEGYRGPNGNNFYDRSLVNTGLGEAWIYHIEGDTRGSVNLVDDGDWVRFRNSISNRRY